MNDSISYSLSGPVVRSVGIRKDIRFYRSDTYASYWFLSMQSFLGRRGDSYDRFLIRIREMYESINIVFQVLSNLTNSHKLSTVSGDKDVEFMTFFDFLYKVKKKSVK